MATFLKEIDYNTIAKVWLVTTNDNLRALKFYQKRNWEIIGLHLYAVKEARKIKDSIPLLGYDNIPILHEIELALILDR